MALRTMTKPIKFSDTPGLAAVTNAIVGALAEFGIEHIDLPATPERVWRAIGGARRQP